MRHPVYLKIFPKNAQHKSVILLLKTFLYNLILREPETDFYEHPVYMTIKRKKETLGN